jgi:hypothetical protein
MLVTPSLGKDRYQSKRKTGIICFSFLACTSFLGSDTGIATSGSGFLLL